MPNLSDDFEAQDIEYQLDLIRLEDGETRATLDKLVALYLYVVTRLREIDPAGVARLPDRRFRLEKLLIDIQSRLARTYAAIGRRQAETAAVVAEDTSDHIAEVLLLLLGVDLVATLTKSQAGASADKPVLGRGIAEQWKIVGRGDAANIEAALSHQVENDQTLSQMVDALRGTKEARYQDGLFARLQRNAETLVRTQIQAASNAARYSTYLKNSDLIRGVQAKNPLDARTSQICRARAGKAWTLDGRPIKGTNIAWPGPPPWHYNCRTVLIPIFRRYEDIAGILTVDQRRTLGQLGDEKKAGIDGQPAGDLTFQSYLSGLSAEQQKKLLGPGRYELWKKGKIAMSDLISKTGKPLTLETLRERIAARKNRRVSQP